ncbi:hypothetical protein [Novacetimonas pomaceti]|uniref:hypothetical protein n=1 Tax=Novacetimonas pomaceti TaxID=2021998 RepID=UPI001C2CD8C7|nr:hypothetical protein [Novacetimonas pomaceti]MBV1834984.1 hypothetical protein [Novacetimonas pomaceti]
MKVFGEAFCKKLRRTPPVWKKATPGNFYHFLIDRLFSDSALVLLEPLAGAGE